MSFFFLSKNDSEALTKTPGLIFFLLLQTNQLIFQNVQIIEITFSIILDTLEFKAKGEYS